MILREALKNALPPDACIRRHRGGALYIVRNADVSYIEGFTIERAGDATLIYPGEIWMRAFDDMPANDMLGIRLMRFRGEQITARDRDIFILAAKLAETRGGTEALEKSVRSGMAAALREKSGGGALYGAWTLAVNRL